MSATSSWSLVAELHAYAFAETLYDCELLVALSPDGRRIVTMPYSTRFISSFSEYSDPFDDLDIHPLVWDADSGALLLTLRHPQRAHFFNVSPDGHHIITTASDNKVRIWDIANGELLKTQGCDIETDGPHSVGLLSKCSDDSLRIIDPATGDDVRVLKDGGPWHRWAISSGAEVVVEGSLEGWARYWNAEGEMRFLLDDDGPIVTCVGVSADGRRIAVGSTIGEIQVWDAQSGSRVNILRVPDCTIDRLEISADGGRIVVSLRNGPLKVWDVTSDTSDEVPEYGGNFRMSLDGRRVVVARAPGEIHVWDQSAVTRKKTWKKATQQIGDPATPLITAKDRVGISFEGLVSRLKNVFRPRTKGMSTNQKQTESTALEGRSSIFVFDYDRMSSAYGFEAFEEIKAGLDGSHGMCAFLDGDLEIAAGGPSGVPRLLMEMRDNGWMIDTSRADSPLVLLDVLDHLNAYVAAMWTDNAENIDLLDRHLTSRFPDAYIGFLKHPRQVDLTNFHNIFRPLELPVRATYVDGKEKVT